jgi:hypothetical protein
VEAIQSLVEELRELRQSPLIFRSPQEVYQPTSANEKLDHHAIEETSVVYCFTDTNWDLPTICDYLGLSVVHDNPEVHAIGCLVRYLDEQSPRYDFASLCSNKMALDALVLHFSKKLSLSEIAEKLHLSEIDVSIAYFGTQLSSGSTYQEIAEANNLNVAEIERFHVVYHIERGKERREVAASLGLDVEEVERHAVLFYTERGYSQKQIAKTLRMRDKRVSKCQHESPDEPTNI